MGSWLMYLLQKKGLTQIINIIFGQLAENSARTQNPRQLNLSVHGRLSFFKTFFRRATAEIESLHILIYAFIILERKI